MPSRYYHIIPLLSCCTCAVVCFYTGVTLPVVVSASIACGVSGPVGETGHGTTQRQRYCFVLIRFSRNVSENLGKQIMEGEFVAIMRAGPLHAVLSYTVFSPRSAVLSPRLELSVASGDRLLRRPLVVTVGHRSLPMIHAYV